MNPKQSKFNKPVGTAILNVMIGSDPDMTTYLDELLKTSKPELQKNTSLGKTEYHTPIQTGIL